MYEEFRFLAYCDSGSGISRVSTVPMRATTVRFGEDLWAMLEDEAGRSGLSAAQFVREATILRLAMLAGIRGDEAARATLATVAGNANAAGSRTDPVARAVSDGGRLAALHRTELLDSAPDERFDGLARIAAKVVHAPVAMVSLVDEDRQFFKSCVGLTKEPWASARETPLSHSFCKHAVASRRPLIVDDAREDPSLRDNLAIRDLDVIAYAGIPLIGSDGHALGTLCVVDHRPRHWRAEETALLQEIANTVVAQIESL
jgi:GAF domain-containing protein